MQYRIFSLIGLILFAAGCNNKKDVQITQVDPEFGQYIAAYTSGFISREATIKVRFVDYYSGDSKMNEPLEDNPFSFSPSIKGEAYWTDGSTIEFKPAEPLESGEFYNATLELGEIKDVPSAFRNFKFQFRVLEQHIELVQEGFRPAVKNDLRRQLFTGKLLTSDAADNATVEKLLTAKQEGEDLSISWEHDEGRKTHTFTINNIKRDDEESSIVLQWDGDEIESNDKGELKIKVPALGDFSLTNSQFEQEPEQMITLYFSDPIKENQDLTGLIHFTTSSTEVRTIVEGNTIRVYPAQRMSGSYTLAIEKGIRNVLDYKLPNRSEIEIMFESLEPSVRLSGNGVILPDADALHFPFEAVSLKMVDVTVSRIFENNILQFLQVNDLQGEEQMQRVAKVVAHKSISLQNFDSKDLANWSTYHIDLSSIIQPEPGALYRVTIGFKKSYSLYPCAGSEEDEEEEEEDLESMSEIPVEDTYWDDFYDYDYYYYDWEHRDDPCHKAYYGKRRAVSRNVLASNLGMIAKKGNTDEMVFAISNITTATPAPDVILEVYDYQQQLIKRLTTDADGMAKMSSKGRPYVVVAKKGNERGYLRLDPGEALSYSRFDVSGEQVEKGLKGFIYGERGVWRPGDSLYLGFILSDETGKLPDGYPVQTELYNPMGQLMQKRVVSNAINGFYNISTATASEAPTGNWSIKVKAGGASFSKTLKIETVKPNRLKISYDFPDKALTGENTSLSGTLQVKWLHGAIARNLKADVTAQLHPAVTKFPKYGTYTFDDPMKKYTSDEIAVFDGRLDNEGKANVSMKFNTEKQSPGMLEVALLTKAYEPGGDFSTDRYTLNYHPYNVYTGILMPKGDKQRGMLLTDTTHNIHLLTVNANGTPAANRKIKYEIYEIEWRWWWDETNQSNSGYNQRTFNNPIQTGTVTTNSRGEAVWKLKINYPEWGRYYVRATDEDGHSTGKIVYIDWPGWAGRQQRENPGGANMLIFNADKEKYTVGEDVNISFPSSEGGRALVTIESGSEVKKAMWVSTVAGFTKFKFTAAKEMAPNVYVNISYLQPYAQTANDLPLRMYGVIPVAIENPGSKLQPVISMPAELRPEQQVKIAVKEEKGQPMTYTLAVVEEGLLDLTRFKTPNPWGHFYAREALGVRSWDMYDMVMGAKNSKASRLLSIGGDEALNKGAAQKANRFKPVVKFFGPYTIKANATNTHSFTMPQYIGAVRVMVVAGYNKAYGSAEKSVPVRQPLMVLGSLPRVLSTGDNIKLPVTVFAMDKKVKDVEVEVNVSGGLTASESKQSLTFKEPGEDIAEFSIAVPEKPGIAKVSISAKSGSFSARETIEIEIRNPNPYVTRTTDTVLDAGQIWQASYTPVGMQGTNSSTIEFSTIPPVNLADRLNYLIRYPHGCLEQTTSAVFAQLYIEKLMDLSAEEKARIDRHIKIGIDKIKNFQSANGGLSYWPGQGDADDWTSSYAGHFMLEAQQRGYAVPDVLIKRWKQYQMQAANRWSYRNTYRSDLIQAYRLYTLALAKEPAMGAMNRLREYKDLTIPARWRLAAAYALAGRKEVALDIIKNLSMDIKPYREHYLTYGSDTRDEAMILETLTILGERSKGFTLLKRLSQKVGNSNYWLSTQEGAYALMAIAKYAGYAAQQNEMNVIYSVRSKEATFRVLKPVHQVNISNPSSAGELSVKNNSKVPVFVRVISKGTPKPGNEEPYEKDLKVSVKYFTADGVTLDPSKLEQGTNFLAEVSISNPGVRGDYRQMALTQIFPSGWEIINTRLLEMEGIEGKSDIPEYEDIRDDRVMTYFDLNRNTTKRFRVMLNASYLGEYYLPALQCEAMYDNSIGALLKGRTVQVVKPGRGGIAGN